MATPIVVSLESAGCVFPLDTATRQGPPWSFSLGRGSHNDVALDDPTVSDSHAKLEVRLLGDNKAVTLKVVAVRASRTKPAT